MAVRPPQAEGEVKYGYVIVTSTVGSKRDVTRLVQLPNFFHSWTATDCLRECNRRAIGVCTEAWPAVRDAHASCGIFA